MSDFKDALRAQLERNAEIEKERRRVDEELDRREEEIAEDRRTREQEAARERADRHAELAAHLEQLASDLQHSEEAPFVVRAGWSATGEEFVADFQSVQIRPKRSLLVEVDRDDDEVLARWRSDLGDALELYRLTEVTPQMLSDLVLKLVDQGYWRSASQPPEFPGNTY